MNKAGFELAVVGDRLDPELKLLDTQEKLEKENPSNKGFLKQTILEGENIASLIPNMY